MEFDSDFKSKPKTHADTLWKYRAIQTYLFAEYGQACRNHSALMLIENIMLKRKPLPFD